jgi:hypothetical protein
MSAIIKQLAWGETSYGTPEVTTPVGVYRIVHAGNGGWCANIKGETLRDTDGTTNFATLEEAKAASQSDFERRVLSCIMCDRDDRLELALRSIAEGNLGDASWEANYDRIRDVAIKALGVS